MRRKGFDAWTVALSPDRKVLFGSMKAELHVPIPVLQEVETHQSTGLARDPHNIVTEQEDLALKLAFFRSSSVEQIVGSPSQNGHVAPGQNLPPPQAGHLIKDNRAFIEEHRIRSYEADPDQRTNIVTIANLLQVAPLYCPFPVQSTGTPRLDTLMNFANCINIPLFTHCFRARSMVHQHASYCTSLNSLGLWT